MFDNVSIAAILTAILYVGFLIFGLCLGINLAKWEKKHYGK